MIFDLIPLVFLGAISFVGVLFRYFTHEVHTYYKKHGKPAQGTIIAFKEETKTRLSDHRKTRTTTIRPVIEFFNSGERVLFLGSDQNYLSNYIGKKVGVYYLPGKKDHVLQSNNIYKVFSYVALIFIIVPIIIIYFLKADLILKLTLPFLGVLLLLPLLNRVKATMLKNARKMGKSKDLFEILREQMLKNSEIIDYNEFKNSQDYIKEKKKFQKKLGNTHLVGVMLCLAFGVGLYFLSSHVFTKTLSSQERSLFKNFYLDQSKYQPILNELGTNSEVTAFVILLGFLVILIFGLVVNLRGWLKNS